MAEFSNKKTNPTGGNDQEFGADEAVYRGMPAASFENNDEEQTFTLNELEGDIDRGLGPSSGYEPRSVQVASYREENLSFVDAFSSAAHTKQYIDTSVASFSSASMDVIVPEPHLVPPAPFHLDLNTHDVPKSVANACKIHAQLTDTFDAHQVDVLFKPAQWLFIAKAYPNNERVEFRVCLYNTTENHYKLEFQLLDGERSSYHSLLHLMKSDLNLPTHANRLTMGYSNGGVGGGGGFASSSTSTSSSAASKVSEDNVKQIVNMIDSKYVDVKIEGLKLGYKLIRSHPGILPTFVAKSGVAAVLTAIDSERGVVEVQRCGASCLNMYCTIDHDQECQTLLKAPNGMNILKRLALLGPNHGHGSHGSDSKSSGFSFFEEEDDDDDLSHLEVQRQAASALAAIASRSSTCSFVQGINGGQIFSDLEKSGDLRLMNIAREGLRYVQQGSRTHY